MLAIRDQSMKFLPGARIGQWSKKQLEQGLHSKSSVAHWNSPLPFKAISSTKLPSDPQAHCAGQPLMTERYRASLGPEQRPKLDGDEVVGAVRHGMRGRCRIGARLLFSEEAGRDVGEDDGEDVNKNKHEDKRLRNRCGGWHFSHRVGRGAAVPLARPGDPGPKVGCGASP